MKKTRTKTGLVYRAIAEDQQMLAGAIHSHKLILQRATNEARSRRAIDPIDARMWRLMADACEAEEQRFIKLLKQL